MQANDHLSSNLSIKTKPHVPALPIALLVLACLSLLLGGPSVCRAATWLGICGDEYDEPGASGPGWEWRDEDTLVLDGYNGCNISIEGDMTLVLKGSNSATFGTSEYFQLCAGVDCSGNLTIRGDGSLAARGPQAGILVMGGTLSIEGAGSGGAGGAGSAADTAGAPAIDAVATGGISEALFTGVYADALRVSGGAQVKGSCAAAGDIGSYGVCVGANPDAAGRDAVISDSTVDAEGLTGGLVAVGGIALNGVGVTLPRGGSTAPVTAPGATGATGVVDPAGAMAVHAVIAPAGGTGGGAGEGGSGGGTRGETGTGGSGGTTTEPTAPGGGTGSDTGNKPAGGEPQPGSGTPAAKPATPAGDNGSGAKPSAKPAAQATGAARADNTAGALPKMGDLPVHILLLALASAAFFAWTRLKARA